MTIQELFECIIDSCQQDWQKEPVLLDELASFFTPLIHSNRFDRKQLVLSAGQTPGHLYFLTDGIARGFYLDADSGNEKTFFLWGQHSIATDPESFFRQTPTTLFIELMPQTEVMSISYADIMWGIHCFPQVRLFSRSVIQQYGIYHAKRNYDLAHFTAWERYLNLLEMHPDIEQFVSKAVLASYLSIAPQSLSRMLKKRGHP